MTADPFVLTSMAIADAIRLLPSRYDEPPILEALVGTDAARLDAAYELDALTNTRHTHARPCAHEPGFLLPENTLLHSHIVNGAFTHGDAHGRFSSAYCGTWYSSDTISTAQAEVGHHKLWEYADLDPIYLASVLPLSPTRYTAWSATYTASLHVLDPHLNGAEEVLDPMDYRTSQRVAEHLRSSGSLGLIYPSVRHARGTCHAIFHPSIVQAVHVESHWDFVLTDLEKAPEWIPVPITS